MVFEDILTRLPSQYLKLDKHIRSIHDKYSHHYELGMEMSCARSPDDDSIAFMPFAESFSKKSYQIGEDTNDVSLLRQAVYQLTPRADRACFSQFNFRIHMGNPDMIEIFISTHVCGRHPPHNRKTYQAYTDRRDQIQQKSLLFIDQYRKAHIPMVEGSRYPYEVTSDLAAAADLCESYNKAFRVFHDTEIRRSTPRLNLHMAFDAGFLSDLPSELRGLIMNKIDGGIISYIPGQFCRRMESTEAAWVSMVMSRLESTEKETQMLRDEVGSFTAKVKSKVNKIELNLKPTIKARIREALEDFGADLEKLKDDVYMEISQRNLELESSGMEQFQKLRDLIADLESQISGVASNCDTRLEEIESKMESSSD